MYGLASGFVEGRLAEVGSSARFLVILIDARLREEKLELVGPSNKLAVSNFVAADRSTMSSGVGLVSRT